ncbi:UDP-N-acetylmuramoyl-L-alanyl-D-glutamate--2,6-diaminopimelate ligase [Acetobacter conturbans]|uniref:UDP-N-acetylmuramoyl-L-alanyl-D-glutamate--2,6-diaminopimelate ligase n=1 Tax=Acetobacter conturbans TaxID=1737472 RepID=A0ABX0K3Z5_9PROT|nr:UDP-N-acetylmuramoyl-L-alanyl-D-glutamate--2,6-diaminopimelate ligase [Acetobacter conturbans]NHN89368.1 UDP-N-acetylmuramoyl-L-alanyl-D-glutamate--2,6-diaminopimelate ligase [Acetobacter conturbans]
MKLSSLLSQSGLKPASLSLGDPEITAITADSRAVQPGSLFVALPGTQQDGRAFIPGAIAAGAAAILVPEGTGPLENGVPVAITATPRRSLALLAATLAGPQPEHIVAVTGTNGKTSTVDFLRQIWQGMGRTAASFGTLGLVSPVPLPVEVPSLTTPDPVTLARGLAALRERGVTDVAMEASSHGLDQRRLDGVRINAAGFTNLTRDHLDYHGSLESYRAAKLRLFDTLLPGGGLAVANADMDEVTLAALRDLQRRRDLELRLVGRKGTTIRLLAHKALPEGQRLRLEIGKKEMDVTLALPGRFQVDNALLAAALAGPDKADMEAAIALLPTLHGVRGRMERAAILPNGAAVYVDYAHTPDALARAIDSLRPHVKGRLLVLFGAGGDRDKGKRPLMAQEAAQRADMVFVTDDNPRSEDAQDIRQDVLAGAPEAIEIPDRRTAIAETMGRLASGDVLLVAGKGHEQGQIIGEIVHPFDDVSVVKSFAGKA